MATITPLTSILHGHSPIPNARLEESYGYSSLHTRSWQVVPPANARRHQLAPPAPPVLPSPSPGRNDGSSHRHHPSQRAAALLLHADRIVQPTAEALAPPSLPKGSIASLPTYAAGAGKSGEQTQHPIIVCRRAQRAKRESRDCCRQDCTWEPKQLPVRPSSAGLLQGSTAIYLAFVIPLDATKERGGRGRC